LLNRLQGDDEPHQIVLATRLVVRASS
jgi:DNA-binding LacI/PurR family transcriptional regulator